MNELEEKTIQCPYCGESICILIDCSVSEQEYIEDCQVCCRPIGISVFIDHDGSVQVRAAHEND